jgi:hypothetical protein
MFPPYWAYGNEYASIHWVKHPAFCEIGHVNAWQIWRRVGQAAYEPLFSEPD